MVAWTVVGGGDGKKRVGSVCTLEQPIRFMSTLGIGGEKPDISSDDGDWGATSLVNICELSM